MEPTWTFDLKASNVHYKCWDWICSRPSVYCIYIKCLSYTFAMDRLGFEEAAFFLLFYRRFYVLQRDLKCALLNFLFQVSSVQRIGLAFTYNMLYPAGRSLLLGLLFFHEEQTTHTSTYTMCNFGFPISPNPNSPPCAHFFTCMQVTFIAPFIYSGRLA